MLVAPRSPHDQVKKRLQQSATLRTSQSAAADGTSGGTYRCVPPAAVANRLRSSTGACHSPGAALLSDADLGTLDRERLVVVDGAVPDVVLSAASREFDFLLDTGLLQSDAEDLCEPIRSQSSPDPLAALDGLLSIAPECP